MAACPRRPTGCWPPPDRCPCPAGILAAAVLIGAGSPPLVEGGPGFRAVQGDTAITCVRIVLTLRGIPPGGSGPVNIAWKVPSPRAGAGLGPRQSLAARTGCAVGAVPLPATRNPVRTVRSAPGRRLIWLTLQRVAGGALDRDDVRIQHEQPTVHHSTRWRLRSPSASRWCRYRHRCHRSAACIAPGAPSRAYSAANSWAACCDIAPSCPPGRVSHTYFDQCEPSTATDDTAMHDAGAGSVGRGTGVVKWIGCGLFAVGADQPVDEFIDGAGLRQLPLREQV